jgi:hypothetical protein
MTIWTRFKRWLDRRQEKPTTGAEANTDAKRRLDDFRQNELSLGAAMRRGERIDVAPGQLWSGSTASDTAIQSQCASVMHRGASSPEALSTGVPMVAAFSIALSTGMALDSPQPAADDCTSAPGGSAGGSD